MNRRVGGLEKSPRCGKVYSCMNRRVGGLENIMT